MKFFNKKNDEDKIVINKEETLIKDFEWEIGVNSSDARKIKVRYRQNLNEERSDFRIGTEYVEVKIIGELISVLTELKGIIDSEMRDD